VGRVADPLPVGDIDGARRTHAQHAEFADTQAVHGCVRAFSGNDAVPEPHGTSSLARWAGRLRRVRNEAGLYLLRGAATAVRGAIVAYGGVWLHAR
jgi:hypothetical protein